MKLLVRNNNRQDVGTLKDLEKDRETTFQKIRQRQGCEDKQKEEEEEFHYVDKTDSHHDLCKHGI